MNELDRESANFDFCFSSINILFQFFLSVLVFLILLLSDLISIKKVVKNIKNKLFGFSQSIFSVFLYFISRHLNLMQSLMSKKPKTCLHRVIKMRNCVRHRMKSNQIERSELFNAQRNNKKQSRLLLNKPNQISINCLQTIQKKRQIRINKILRLCKRNSTREFIKIKSRFLHNEILQKKN